MKQELSEGVVGCVIEVSRRLGAGFLEKVYEGDLAVELRGAGIEFTRQHAVPVFYRDEPVGDYVCDFIIGERLVVEIKALRAYWRA